MGVKDEPHVSGPFLGQGAEGKDKDSTEPRLASAVWSGDTAKAGWTAVVSRGECHTVQTGRRGIDVTSRSPLQSSAIQ